jgi:hypothetical protein
MTHTDAHSSPVALSVMIPNYNYARYIGETIQSVLDQAPRDVEVVVADNASTDDSVAVVRGIDDARVRFAVNPCNLGFAANLERVAAMARGRRMLLLSSDDRMRPGTIDAYARLEAALGAAAERAVWGSAIAFTDAEGKWTGTEALDAKFWSGAQEDKELSRAVGHRVFAMPAHANLRRSLQLLRTSLPFATLCYPKKLHDDVGGYSGGRLMNPDKWFLWKVLAAAEMVYVIDEPLFEYRVHSAGQGPQEQRSGALKHLTDQYIATFNLPEQVLQAAGLEREQLAQAFIEQDIALRGLLALSHGRRQIAWRSVQFGRATYPDLINSNPKIWLLRALLRCGPAGIAVARLLRDRTRSAWQARESRPGT